MGLSVYTAEHQEYVIAGSPEDAAAVYAAAESAGVVHYDTWKPTAWEPCPTGDAFTFHDNGHDYTASFGEWAERRGRGYFASANY